ncbi:MAG: DNA polymerase III subunit delta' [Candidatus Schekmanbacteria bacterium]|nr:DNA polymerase III subunit delta' [Candidatus Schekmanbacteria bacterium]
MGWNQIKGQNRVVKILCRALAQKRLPHAYLFYGIEGVGKKLTALHLAKVVNCRQQTEEPCGICPACHKVDKAIHPDVILIQPEEGESIKIEQIRRLQEEIAYKPFEGYFKVWIIDQADKMTQQAANCLLKTLEEPPASSLIILLAVQEESLLPTIISRCQTL